MSNQNRIKHEELSKRLDHAFRSSTLETGRVPTLDEAIAWDTQQGNEPKISRSSANRYIDMMVDPDSKKANIHNIQQYLAAIGIRSIVLVDNEIVDSVPRTLF